MKILKGIAMVAVFCVAAYIIISTILCVGGVLELNQILEPKRQMLNELAKILG